MDALREVRLLANVTRIGLARLALSLSLALLAILLAGCATVPMGDSRDDVFLKSFPTVPGVAGLYIYRQSGIYASGLPITVEVNGNPIGQTAAGTYLYTEVPPGTHTIASTSAGPHVADSIAIQTLAGRNYFIHQDMVLNLLALQTRLRLVSDEEGQRGVRATTLAHSQFQHRASPPPWPIPAPVAASTPAPEVKGDPLRLFFGLSGTREKETKPQALAPATRPVPASVAAAAVVPAPAPAPVSTVAHAQPTLRKMALVIGNGSYREAPLKNPVNDARAITTKLRDLGFEVMLGENLGLREMTRLITRFGEKANGSAVGLFFYAGHGMQVKGRNYLLPVDAQISSEASARSESVDLEQILDQLAATGGQFSLVVLDACRNNPFERRFRGTTGGLAQIDAPKGTLIAYATSPGRVALDGDGENSTYTSALLNALDHPGLPVEAVFKRVRGDVARSTSDQQIPWESSSLTGDFFFRPPAGTIATDPVAGTESELVFWQSINASKDADDFRAYLRRYPNGQFSEIAKNRIKRLTGK